MNSLTYFLNKDIYQKHTAHTWYHFLSITHVTTQTNISTLKLTHLLPALIQYQWTKGGIGDISLPEPELWKYQIIWRMRGRMENTCQVFSCSVWHCCVVTWSNSPLQSAFWECLAMQWMYEHTHKHESQGLNASPEREGLYICVRDVLLGDDLDTRSQADVSGVREKNGINQIRKLLHV